MKAPTQSSKPRVLCPRGTHLCRCVQVIDLGTQHFTRGDDGSRKLYLAFETCTEKHVFDEAKGPEPFMLQQEFAFYMGRMDKKTKLRKFLESWFGKAFPSDQAAQDFDFSKLLGRSVMLTVGHVPKADDTMKAVITDQYLPGTGVEVPPPVNPLICYEIKDGQNSTFNSLPNFLKKKILEADEMQEGAGQDAESFETSKPANNPPAKKEPEEESPF